MVDFNNKNILLVAPYFFGYEKMIKLELEKHNASVTLIYENLEQKHFAYRIVNTYFRGLKKKIDNRYYKQKLYRSSEFDYVFVIRGTNINKKIMKNIRACCKDTCKFIMYQWDSVKNNPISLELAPMFDKVFTFDPNDAEEQNWLYRPLFFNEALVVNKKLETDVLFIGSLHSNRVKILHLLNKYFEKKDIHLLAKLYVNPIIYLKKRFLSHEPAYVEAKFKDVYFKPLTVQDCYKLYCRSNIIVDYASPGQTGLTMRAIESLGCKCKLVTNNKRILQSNLYHENNVFIFDENNFELPDEFIKSAYHEANESIYEYYSLRGWISTIFDNI